MNEPLIDKWKREREETPPDPGDMVRDAWWKIKDGFRDLRWHLRVILQFAILKFHKENIPAIEVYDYAVKPCPYIDACIKLPVIRPWTFFTYWIFRTLKWEYHWIFTIDTKDVLIFEKSYDDLHTLLWWNKNITHYELTPIEYLKKISDEAETILKEPIIEYEMSYTGKSELTDEDLLEISRLWIKKWYPELSEKEVVLGKG